MHNLLRTEDHGDFEHNFPHDRRLNRPHWRKARRSEVSGEPKSKLQSVLEAGKQQGTGCWTGCFLKVPVSRTLGKVWERLTLTEQPRPREDQQCRKLSSQCWLSFLRPLWGYQFGGVLFSPRTLCPFRTYPGDSILSPHKEMPTQPLSEFTGCFLSMLCYLTQTRRQ